VAPTLAALIFEGCVVQGSGLVLFDAPNAAGPDDMYDIMHIPKTAGTSFEHDASELVTIPLNGRGWNELPYCNWMRPDIANTKVLAMLRDPRAHVLSQYHHCKDSPTHHATSGNDHMPPSFEEWVDKWHDNESSRHVHSSQKQKAIAESTCCYNPTNLVTTRMMCLANATHDMSIAIERIQSLWFLGITEFYTQSICLLAEKTTGRLPPYCVCGSGEQANLTHQDWSVKSHDIKDVSESTLSKIDDITSEDRTLYEVALKRFTAEVKEVESRHNVSMFCASVDQGNARSSQDDQKATSVVENMCIYEDATWHGP
jgi:hypothetical protein